jgi:diguanylate cyclase (GGDEF)-like protein/PAS domain S-box-containing protein
MALGTALPGIMESRPPSGRSLMADDARAAECAQLTLDSIADAVVSSDNAGNVIYLNSAAETMMGWSRSEAKGQPLGDVLQIVDGSTREPLVRNLPWAAIKRDRLVAFAANSVLVRRDGLEFPIEHSMAPIHGRDGQVIGAVIVLHDASEVRATALRMSHLACHDFLTDLPNPVLLRDRITQAIALAHRHDKQLAVLFIDLDRFKSVNDLLGHAVGDELIRSVALRLKASVRDSDTVSRYGGDEFVVLLSETEHAEHAALSADKIIAAVSAPHDVFGRKLRVTASIGVAVYPPDGASTEALLKSADAAMYKVKDTGGNGYRLATQAAPAVRAERSRHLGLVRVG